jgi:flagellar biosynthesis/type III secretory pathway M-ring protein FliF/YscJ
MDYLQKAVGQLIELFRAMPAGTRTSVGLLAVVALVSAAYLGNEQLAGSDAYLMDGETFSASQLHAMHAALGKANLEASIDGARIKVSRGQESKCMAALAEAGALPVEFGGYLEKAVNSSGFMTLNRNQEAAMRIAKQRELQNIINTMVDKSLVLIDEQSDHGFPPKKIITASVSIQPRGQQPLDENRIPAAIRNLVASSVAGLKPEAVTVVDLSTQRTYPGATSGDSHTPLALGEYAELKRFYEREYQEKISRALAPHIAGALVTTSVELDAETAAAPNGTADAAPRTLAHAGRWPKRVAVSIAVPHAYYEQIWRQSRPSSAVDSARKPDAAVLSGIIATEKQKIEALVTSLLPNREPAGAGSQVVVSTFYPLAELPPRDLAPSEQAWAWLGEHGKTLGLVALGLVGLLAVCSLVRSTGRPAAISTHDADTALGLSGDQALAKSAPSIAHDAARHRAPLSPTLRGDLADIVRDDPEAAVTILRTWIGNAG